MLNTSPSKKELNETAKEKAFILILGIIAFTWVTGAFDLSVAPQITEYAVGAILIGINLFRHVNQIEMSKFTWLVGSYIIISAFLDGATLYNPSILPLVGLMAAAYGIFNVLESRLNA